MSPRLKFNIINQLKGVVLVDATEETKDNGEKIRYAIISSGHTRSAVVMALKDDTELTSALNGHNLDLAVLTSATLGTVTLDFSKLLLKKVRIVLGITIH